MLIHQPINEIGQSLTGLEAPYREFNFYCRPPFWDLPLHRHSFFQFLLVISGELSITIDQEEAILSRGMVSLIPPEVAHSFKSKGGYRQFGINLTSTVPEDAMIRILTSHVNNSEVITIPILLDYLPEIEDCTNSQTVVSIQKIRNRLELMLLTCVDMLKKREGSQVFREKLMEYFKENITEILSLEDISRTLFISPSHIERLSYMEYGCGAIHLFHRLKMDRARMLLQTTNLPISGISDHLGYTDQGYFSRIFKKYVGVSPREYQKRRKL